MKYIVIVIFLFNYHYAHSQDDSNIEKDVVKNIILYHIRNASKSEIGLDKNGLLEPQNQKIIDKIFDPNFTLRVEIEKDSINYPISNFEVYRIYKKDFVFMNDSISIKHFLFSFSFDSNYLIAYNKETKVIKFISGNFYLSKISQDFNLELNNPKTFYTYLKMRLYQYGIKNIHFKKRKGDLFYFNGYSNNSPEEVSICLSKDDLDILIIK